MIKHLKLFILSAIFIQGTTHALSTEDNLYHASPPTAGIKQELENEGFTPKLEVNAEVWANTSGGANTGSVGLFQSQFGFELDLKKTSGLDGWTYVMDWHAYYGNSPSITLIGMDEASALSGMEATSNVVRFSNLYLKKEFDDGRYQLRIGQLAADATFMLSQYGAVFINSSFGPLPAELLAMNAPNYPLWAPGVYGYAEPHEDIFMQLGVYTANAGQDVSSNWGFGWSISANDGAGIFYEIGTEQSLWGLPGTYVLGVFATTGDVTLYSSGAQDWGLAYPYLMLNQALITDADGNTVLGGFFRLATNFQADRSVIDLEIDTGLAWFAPIPSRPNDVLGLGFAYNSYESDYLAWQRANGNLVGQQQSILEVTYQVAITEWCYVQPDFQLILDPHYSRRDAWVVGMRGYVSF